MTTNSDRVETILWEAMGATDAARNAAESLIVAGLIAPDLPVPDDLDHWSARWKMPNGAIEAEVLPSGTILTSARGQLLPAPPEELRKLTMIYLAALKHSEEVTP